MNVDVATTAVDQTVRRAAVLGSPIKHSLSPVLHGAAYQALELHGWRYDTIECDEPGLPRLVDSMGPEWAGLSLTMPLKRVALTVADEVSPLARAVGAANTLVFSCGRAGRRQAGRQHGCRRHGRGADVRPGWPASSGRSSWARAAPRKAP